MTQEKQTGYTDSQSSQERKKIITNKPNYIKLGRNILIGLGIAAAIKAGGQIGSDVYHDAKDLLSQDDGIKIEQAFSEYASENSISSELVTVFVESGDNVENLCKSKMIYDKDNQPDWREVTHYVINLKENKPLFRDGRILQPGDELYIPARIGVTQESPDK